MVGLLKLVCQVLVRHSILLLECQLFEDYKGILCKHQSVFLSLFVCLFACLFDCMAIWLSGRSHVISCCSRFCSHLDREKLQPYLSAAVNELVTLATQSDEGVLELVLDVMLVAIKVASCSIAIVILYAYAVLSCR